MLPTTFRDELKREEELKKRLKAKLEVARFLQETVKVMAKGLKQSRSGYTREKADKLYDFMKKVRSGDATVTNEDITRFAKLFGDEFTLDHISRGQLTNMCKLVGIAPYGTDGYLRNSLRDKLRDLKNDDKVIRREGVESLSVAELQSVSRARACARTPPSAPSWSARSTIGSTSPQRQAPAVAPGVVARVHHHARGGRRRPGRSSSAGHGRGRRELVGRGAWTSSRRRSGRTPR